MNVSVIIPVYNAQNFLEQAVLSALKHKEVQEIILVEDGSTDQSLKVAQELQKKHKEIKLFQHPNGENRGAGASRNVGITHATLDYIAFLDADDVFTDLRFTAEKEYFTHPKIEGVFGAIGVQFLSDKGKEQFQQKFNKATLTTVNYPAEGKEVFKGLMHEDSGFGLFFSLIGLTVRRDSLLKNNLWFNEGLKVHQDTDFIRRLSFYTYLKSGIIDQAVALRGVHDENRITQIKQYSSSFYYNINLLFRSIYHWVKSENSIEPFTQKHIYRMHVSFETANKKGITKYVYFFSRAIGHPLLLKTRYRFHAFNSHSE